MKDFSFAGSFFACPNFTKYVLGEMVAINQLDNLPAATADAAETVPVDSTKLATADAIVLKSGDSKGSPVAIQAVALQAAPGYTVNISKASAYKNTARIVRVYGLDATKTVTIDGVDARYYTNSDNELVHIAAVAKSDAEPVIGFKDETPKKIVFGDVNGNGNSKPNLADATLFKRTQAGYTPAGGSKFVYPTDPMECLVWDINGDGNVNLADATLMKRTQAGYTPAGGSKFTYDNLTVYSVK